MPSIAVLATLLAAVTASALPPPQPVEKYFKDADVAASGTLEELKVETLGDRQFRVSYLFRVAKLWKGTDKDSFRHSTEVFDPAGSEESLRSYYGQDKYVFFYKRTHKKTKNPAGEVIRDSLWIAPVTEQIFNELTRLTEKPAGKPSKPRRKPKGKPPPKSAE